MATVYSLLPVELWDLILSYLILPDLEAINLTSHYFHKVAQTCLQRHRDLYRQASEFKAEKYGDFEIVPWLQPLLQVLRDPCFASYVTEIDTEIDQTSSTLNSWLESEPEKKVDEYLPDTDMVLLRQAAQICFADWFDTSGQPEYRKEFFDDVEQLEQSALLAILLCHLPNIRILTLTAGCWGGLEDAPWLERLAERFHLRPDTPLQGNKPFARLEHLRGDIFNGFYGLDLETIAPFIALPTLKWLETPQNHEEGFEWPEHLPRSNVREILLNQSTVPESAVRRFAAEALRGPCVIRQAWTSRHDSTPEATWTRFLVPFEGAEAEEHILQLGLEDEEFRYDWWRDDIGWEVKSERGGVEGNNG